MEQRYRFNATGAGTKEQIVGALRNLAEMIEEAQEEHICDEYESHPLWGDIEVAPEQGMDWSED